MTSEKMSKSQNYGRYSYTTDVWKAISGKTVLYMLLAAVSVALKMGFAFLVSEIVDGAINFEMTRLQRLFFFLILFLVVRYVTSRLYSRVNFAIIEQARSYLREKLVRHFLRLPLHLGQKFENYENLVVTNVDMVIDDYYKSILDLAENWTNWMILRYTASCPFSRHSRLCLMERSVKISPCAEKIQRRKKAGCSSSLECIRICTRKQTSVPLENFSGSV